MDTELIWKNGTNKEKEILNHHVRYIIIITTVFTLMAVFTGTLMSLNAPIQYFFKGPEITQDTITVCV